MGATLLAALDMLGCAQGRALRKVQAPTEPHVVLENQALGYRVELPEDWSFLAGNVGDYIVALGDDRVEIRLFPEHFASEPSPEQCWERLFQRLPQDLEDPPETPNDLAIRGPSGLSRFGGRRMHVAPFQREQSCMVLMVSGPASGSRLDEVARIAFGSFELRPPAESMRTRLAFDAASQLLEMGEYASALRRFEEVIGRSPELLRAHLGAGLAAVLLGEGAAQQAISYLESYMSLRKEQFQGRMGDLEWEQLKDALMHLGIAYATVKDYPRARARLGEFTLRFPEDPIGQYNFACVLSLSGDLDLALDHLELSFRMDPSLIEHARGDEDLIPLHPLSRYQELVSSVAD